MAIELHGKDFQAWRNFDLIIDGVTVVIGPSNVGKSAIQRALRGLVRNTLSASQLRVGGDGMEVSLTINGQTITARRDVGKRGAIKSISYQIGDKTYDKLQKALPDEVHALNMNEIEIGDVSLDPIFASQFGSQFLLEEKPAPLNQILGAFSSTEKLEAGKRTANGRIAGKNAEAKTLAVEMRDTEERKAKLGILAEQATAIQTVVDSIEPELRRQEQITVLLDALMTQRRRLDRLNALITEFVIPDSEPVARLIDVVQAAEQARSARTAHQRVTDILSRLEVPDASVAITHYKIAYLARETVIATEKLGALTYGFQVCDACVQAFNVAGGEYKRGLAIAAAVAALEAKANSRPTAYLKRLEKYTAKLDSMIKTNGVEAGTLTLIDQLIEHKGRLEHMKITLGACEIDLTTAQGAVHGIEAAQREHQQHLEMAKRANMKVCPKCGEPINAAA